MVEKVEDLRPELDPQPFVDLGVLEYREIYVVEIRSGDGIATEVAEVKDTAARHRQCKDRIGITGAGGGGSNPRIADCIREPGVRARVSEDANGTNNIGSECRRPGEAINIGDDGDGIAALRLCNAGYLPAFDQTIAFERQFIDPVDDEPMTGIEI